MQMKQKFLASQLSEKNIVEEFNLKKNDYESYEYDKHLQKTPDRKSLSPIIEVLIHI